MMSTEPPRFDEIPDQGLKKTLELCGRVVVREIIRCVSSRLKPSGAPQKANAPSTIARKGHDHPLVERIGRFMRQGSYSVTPRDEMSVVIALSRAEDSEIAARLEGKGYEFFGITDKADEEAYRIMDGYLIQAVNKAFGSRP